MTEIGLRTVQRTIETWKDSGEPSAFLKKWVRKKNCSYSEITKMVVEVLLRI